MWTFTSDFGMPCSTAISALQKKRWAEKASEKEWNKGRDLSFDEAVELALEAGADKAESVG